MVKRFIIAIDRKKNAILRQRFFLLFFHLSRYSTSFCIELYYKTPELFNTKCLFFKPYMSIFYYIYGAILAESSSNPFFSAMI